MLLSPCFPICEIRYDYPPHWDAMRLCEVMATDSGALESTVKTATPAIIIIEVLETYHWGQHVGSDNTGSLSVQSLVEWSLRHAGRQDGVQKVLWQ